ncbi:phytanoyl-CoA dioxygenase family protein [Halorussus caseinilyticus]|uniref:Phytanoyl-CoA dioxygenase family protein n=1 Tax=Halorussus caseinilyticus TaxID=3034025 RepID=A0ABD5WJK4_9EURY
MSSQFYRHVDSPVVYDLCSRREIVERMRQLYGDDLMLWSTKFWEKVPGTTEVPWHQHYHHVLVDPPVTLTAWIALTDVTVENGAMELIPGSHDEVIPEVESPPNKSFQHMADPDEFSTDDTRRMEIDAGEAFIFDERTLHRSFENTSEDRRRLALTMRVTVPFASFDPKGVGGDEENEFTTAMMLSGTNTVGKNRTIDPPTSAD